MQIELSPDDIEAIIREADAAAQRLRRKLCLPLCEREDLGQDLLVDLLRRLPAYEPARGSIGAFANIVLRNQSSRIAMRHHRERRAQGGSLLSLEVPLAGTREPVGDTLTEDDGLAAWHGQTCCAAAATELHYAVEAALARLPAEDLPVGRALLEPAGMTDAPEDPPDTSATQEDPAMTTDHDDNPAPPEPHTPGPENLVHFNPWRDFNDAAPQIDVFGDEPDPAQIAQFMEAVFGYSDGLIPVRSFIDKGQGFDGRPHNIWIEADAAAPDKMVTFAGWAAREGAAVYVIPGTVAEPGQARAADIEQMQTVVVDLDTGDIAAARAHLARHLGPPTMVVESGGVTPEGQRKAHVWWKLTEPADILDGRWDNAEVEVWRVNWADTSQRVLMRRGAIGQIRRGRLAFVAEVRSLAHVLGQTVGRTFQATCDAALGDTRCGVDLENPAFKGTGAVIDLLRDRAFTASGLGVFASGWFTFGTIEWSSGANAGRRAEVLGHDVTDGVAILTLLEAPVRAISEGDAFTIRGGCDKRIETCGAKFANTANFRGFPHIPGQDTILRYASRDGGHDGGVL